MIQGASNDRQDNRTEKYYYQPLILLSVSLLNAYPTILSFPIGNFFRFIVYFILVLWWATKGIW